MSEQDHVPYKDGEGYCSFNFINKPAMIMGIPFGIFMTGIFLMVLLGFGLFFTVGIIGTVIAEALIVLSMTSVKLLCENDPNALKFIKYRLKGYFHKKKFKGKFYHSSVNDIGIRKNGDGNKKTIERKKISEV
ncbi:VirB3 family type IV secretion system protein [Klebsiella quasipneumoniae]|uniref:VirB3 family type IV secretion system protein n=1 Tax=Klebsiella quasipneumoniae TaxID=1463165 RepID=UPI001C9547DB|nr:VirB3 family type IV secretion system protein [Klebsiella quasipneumoniae]MBY5246584.1 hypothetical protein [Klebsiella quasipneumoniae]